MDDADDLFGGLPAVANAENAPAPAVGGSDDASAGAATTSDVAKKSDDPPKPSADEGAEIMAAPAKVPEKRKAAGASLVSSLGTAGTAMAFVPQAIRKKKKVPPQKPQRQAAAPPTIRPTVVAVVKSVNAPQKSKPDKDTAGDSAKAISMGEEARQPFASAITIPSTIDAEKKEESTGQPINNIHDNTGNGEPYLENEPESLRRLHASVTHPYDPHFPNDYLAYRERKKTEQVRKDLQRSALQRLDQQEKMRKKIEEERRKMMASGDLDRIVESHAGEGVGGGAAGTGRGRGRGRGMANLPAWLVKQQQEQKESVSNSGPGQDPPAPGQFTDANQWHRKQMSG